MKSLLPLFISVVGLFILILIYYVFIYQKPETPFDVFLRLIRHNPETILAFTYKKIPPNEYLNYYVTGEQLEPRIEAHPVSFDGLPVSSDRNHGIISDITNGFMVSGIEFPFRCPSGWNYDNNGKCLLDDICQINDVDVYKGINFYQFNEMVAATRGEMFHPRLYMDCNTKQRKNCAANELYIGGESIPISEDPCEPYDICQDMLTMTKHNYPISRGDNLGPNEFYICQNGSSVRRACPNNTQFSRLQNACLPVSRCFDREDNTAIYTGDPNQFILCLNGQENFVRCGHGVFPDPVGCINSICVNPRIIFHRFNDRINIPIGRQYCEPGTNTPVTFNCDISTTTYKDNVQHLINDNLPTLAEPHDRFDSFDIPDKIFDLESNVCVDFIFDTNFVEMGTHNDILPRVPINLETLEITYSGTNTFFYKNYNKIMVHPSNSIVTNPENYKYANFTTITELAAVQYVDAVQTATGDNDGVNYLISGPMLAGLLSTESIYKSPSGETGQNGYAWNAYKQKFTPINEAHSELALTYLTPNFTNKTYTFKYYIESSHIHILTPYGLCSFEFDLKNGAEVQDGKLKVLGMPDFNTMESILAGPNNTMIVSDIYDKLYNPKHRPYFLEYVNIISVHSPEDAKRLDIDKFFEVDSKILFVSDELFG